MELVFEVGGGGGGALPCIQACMQTPIHVHSLLEFQGISLFFKTSLVPQFSILIPFMMLTEC